MTIPAATILRCQGDKIVDAHGQRVILRGACLGGYLLQENFTNGFPGHEKAYRAAMLNAIGQEKYDFFWAKFYEYFFDDADAKWFASIGMNLLRLAINYRHLNDDLEPEKIKESGFKLIDRVIEINARHGIYTIIDLHAAPGGQNFDWHSDNNLPEALLFDHKDFQDRTVRIWEAIAERYKGHPWVAGYNLLNEPTDKAPGATRLLAFYTRLAAAVRAIDTEHIICFDGNTFGADFSAFDKANFRCENAIFSCHDYSLYGFPGGPTYNGTEADVAKQTKGFQRKIGFSQKTDTPIWNGEFGPVYATPVSDGDKWEAVNNHRYEALKGQLKIYDEHEASWTIWLYKDMGVQGILHSSEESKWNKTFEEFINHKRKHGVDFWGTDSTGTAKHFQPAMDFIKETFPSAVPSYPPWWAFQQHIFRRVMYSFIADNLCDEFVAPMKAMSFDELDELAASFKFENCTKREKLVRTLTGQL